MNGTYAQNFIDSTTKFSPFFDTFGQSIFSSLKNLLLCVFGLENGTALIRTLNSFSQLEDMGIIKFSVRKYKPLDLNLPMLKSFKLEETFQISRLTLDAPRLEMIKFREYPFSGDYMPAVKIVHPNSVEKLVVDRQPKEFEVEELKNLKYLYIGHEFDIRSTLLRSLKQLKEIHVRNPNHTITSLFEQKRKYGCTDLKIYLCGLLLDGPGDPAIHSLTYQNNMDTYIYLAENASISRLAGEMPFFDLLSYEAIEAVTSESAIDLNRFPDLYRITVKKPVQDIERFLDVLKNFDKVADLTFYDDQPQELFDRLHEHCAVQQLVIEGASDFAFLAKLKHLISLIIRCRIEAESIQQVLEELKFLKFFQFKYLNFRVDISIEIDHREKQFKVRVDYKETKTVSDVDSAIRFIIDANRQKRRYRSRIESK